VSRSRYSRFILFDPVFDIFCPVFCAFLPLTSVSQLWVARRRGAWIERFVQFSDAIVHCSGPSGGEIAPPLIVSIEPLGTFGAVGTSYLDPVVVEIDSRYAPRMSVSHFSSDF
jgi:hypothetical protein